MGGMSKAGHEFDVGWKGAKQLRKDMAGKEIRLAHEYWKNQPGSYTQQQAMKKKRGTMLTRGGGKAGFFRKLVNNITGNPLE